MKSKLTCYIVDDEPLAQQILSEYVAKVPFLELIGSFDSALDASARIRADKPDVLFLDINMSDLDGLSFIPMLNPKPIIILTTAYGQYAVQAYELEVADYLLKPVSFERFYKSVLRVYQPKGGAHGENKPEIPSDPGADQDYLFIRVGHRIQKLAIREIVFIEGMKDYLRIHTVYEKYMTLMSFARLEDYLPNNRFIRVHKSYMVALDKIEHIERNRIMIAGQTIPVSNTYSERFYRMLRGLE